MNNIWLVTLFCLCCESTSIAQSFINSDNEWEECVFNFGAPPNNQIRNYKFIDTIVHQEDGLDFYPLETKIDDGNWTTSNIPSFAEKEGKIYKRGPQNEIELLYDFNLGLNDIFQSSYNFDQIVTKVDSIQLFNGEIRKRIKISPVDLGYYEDETITWIDGIGALEFPFRGITYPNVIESFDEIKIFKIADIIQYENTEISCDIIDDVNDISKEDLFVYPNPFRDELFFIDLEKYSKVVLYTANGCYIENISSPKINLSHLSNGIYILVFYQNKGSYKTHQIMKH